MGKEAEPSQIKGVDVRGAVEIAKAVAAQAGLNVLDNLKRDPVGTLSVVLIGAGLALRVGSEIRRRKAK